MFIEVSLTYGDTRTPLDTFRAQALNPHGLRFRGQVVNHTLSRAIGLGLRDDYEANQERILLRPPLITSVDNSSVYEYGTDKGYRWKPQRL